ncbi:glycosyltransferase, partial [mine drainage metagenome]
MVIPLMDDLLGNRHGLLVASRLARRAEVDVFVSVAARKIVPEIVRMAAPATVHFDRTRSNGGRSMLRFLVAQLSPWFDRRLARQVTTGERGRPFDAIVVFANEGHGIPTHLPRRPGGQRPVFGVCVLDLPDYVFILGDARNHPAVRRLLRPILLPILHAVERRKLASFDRHFANSRWTEEQLEHLYGIRADASLPVADIDWFRPFQEPARGVQSPY